MLLEVDDVDAKALLAAIPGLLQAPGNPDLARLLSRLQQQLNPPSLGPPLELAPPNRLRNIENTPRDTENLVNKENISRTPPRVSAFPRQHLYSPYGTTLLTTPTRGASRGTAPNSEDSPMPMADEDSSAPALLPRASALLPEFMLRALRAASASPPPSRPITPPLCPGTPMHPTTPVNRPSVLPSTSILSPLRFSGDDDDDELLSPSSTLVNLSPTKSACGDQMQVSDSSAASLLGKRTASEAGLEDGPRRSRRLASSVTEHEADGTGNANGGTHHANSKPPCPRKGDKARVSSKTRRGRAAGNVQAMQATLTKQPSNGPSGKSGKKKKKTAGGRYVMGAPPPPATRDSGLRIVGLGLVPLSVELQQNLLALLRELQPPPPPSEGVSQEDGPAALTGESFSPLATLANPPPPPPSAQVSPFAQAMLRCSRLEKKGVLNDFELMVSLIEAAFYIQGRQNVPAGEKRPSYPELALEVADPSVNSAKIQLWYTGGTRLIYLAACSSMYILPIIAACGLRYKICKEDFFDTIEEIGYLLCAPHAPDEEHVLSRDCGNIVRQYICPQMVWIKQMTTNLDEKMVVNFPPHSNVPAESIPFSSVLRMDAKLRTFNFEYWALPPHDPCWRALENPLLAPVLPLLIDDLDLTEDCVAEEVTIRTGFNLKHTPCPVPPGEGGKAWSEAERLKGAEAKVVGSIGELESELKDFYDEDGERRSDTYLCVPTEIMDGKVLTIRDRDDEVVSLVITNIAETLPHLKDSGTTFISAVMEGEVYPVDSSKGKRYCAVHHGVWNKYTEQGVGAPEGVHPNLLHREDTEKWNYRQRAPYTTRETRDNPEEAELLEELIKLITIVIEVHVFAHKLPLNQRSPAHPFGGYVFNFVVSTDGHRDGGDKIFCVVIPFGEWTGGIRCSLVLHSDKYGDNWVQTKNNWQSRN
ncbi:hypothetical protein DFH06DRAFT_1135269 [Mycena polygramma]|nr:hypothetical protein DFH06DRAFT_1135269 [Mycena polygramma]